MDSKENCNSILVFESPVLIGEDKIYGFIYNNDEWDEESNRYWIEYMAGCKKWIDSGNGINKDNKNWVEEYSDIEYNPHCELAVNYCEQAYNENPITYFYKENISFDYAEEDVDGCYIIGEKFWDWAIGQMDELYNACLSPQEDLEDSDSDDLPF